MAELNICPPQGVLDIWHDAHAFWLMATNMGLKLNETSEKVAVYLSVIARPGMS